MSVSNNSAEEHTLNQVSNELSEQLLSLLCRIGI